MSTIVQMPVRVKPPPADTGDTISPGCASFEMRHAAERRADDRVVDRRLLQRDLALGDLDLLARRRDARDQRIDLGLRLVDLGRRVEAFLAQLLLALQRRAALRSSRTSLSGIVRAAPLRAAPEPAPARACSVESSRRASTWPSRTAMPSSTFTSITLPVTFDETVARRRAVT